MFKRTGKKPDPIRQPAADFAYRFNMITKDEYAACQRDEMHVYNQHLYVIENKVSQRKDRLYQGRADDIMIDRLLGKN